MSKAFYEIMRIDVNRSGTMTHITKEEFSKITGKKAALYSIMPIENIPSIMKQGILCHQDAQSVKHQSVALENVQEKREQKRVCGGLYLHQYANLYFNPRNPMMFYVQRHGDGICILAINPEILNQDGCVISDMNAAKREVRFYEPSALEELDFKQIFAEFWEDEFTKARECAEVLVPHRVDFSYVMGALVQSAEDREKLEKMGFSKDKDIYIDRYRFFGKEDDA